ncbi:IS66 family transposase [Alkalicoccus urumqiensis]|uniref:IS66 family transposase n=1 Tax=Alkalicoccus urumqiensis TaxID=1548213 RepID=UPI0024782BE3|nr:transposase [Alkalicoccus urumqiensis]
MRRGRAEPCFLKRSVVRTSQAGYLPKSRFAKAFQYALNQERPIRHDLQPETRSIDNNRMERGIHSFAVGRNKWMFSRTPQGARVSAAVYSLIDTAKANGLHPEASLTNLMDMFPNLPSMEADGLEVYLPWSDSLPDSLRQK